MKKITTFDQLLSASPGSWIYFIFRGKFCPDPTKERSKLFRIVKICGSIVHLINRWGGAVVQRNNMEEYEITGSSVYVIDNKIHIGFINLFQSDVRDEERDEE